MSISPQELLMYLMVGSVFVLVLSFWLIGIVFWQLKRKLREEKIGSRLSLGDELDYLNPADKQQLWKQAKRGRGGEPGEAAPSGLLNRMEQIRHQAGLEISAESLLLVYVGLLTVPGTLMFLVTFNPLLAVAIAALAFVGTQVYLSIRTKQQTDLFEQQFIDALGLEGRSLRAGHPLMSAFHMIVDEMKPPISRLFGEICQEQALGTDLESAMRRGAASMQNQDFNLFTAAIVIQVRSGGNLADVMEGMAHIVRERIRLRRKVRTLTAQTQLSKYVLLGLPFATFLMIYVINRGYAEPLYTTFPGTVMLCVGGVMLFMGNLVIDRIAKMDL